MSWSKKTSQNVQVISCPFLNDDGSLCIAYPAVDECADPDVVLMMGGTRLTILVFRFDWVWCLLSSQ